MWTFSPAPQSSFRAWCIAMSNVKFGQANGLNSVKIEIKSAGRFGVVRSKEGTSNLDPMQYLFDDAFMS